MRVCRLPLITTSKLSGVLTWVNLISTTFGILPAALGQTGFPLMASIALGCIVNTASRPCAGSRNKFALHIHGDHLKRWLLRLTRDQPLFRLETPAFRRTYHHVECKDLHRVLNIR